MREIARSTVLLAVAGAAAAGLAVLLGADRPDLVLDAYLVYAGALIALAAARVARRMFPAPRGVVPEVIAPPPVRYAAPESLVVQEDDVALAQADAFNLHFRLRPVLAEIAAAGLATRVGVDLERDPERAQRHLSPETWELVRPDRPRPEGSDERGISTASLSDVVSELERILPS